jgi:hypothetical protein
LPRRWRPTLEHLEDRLALSADILVTTAGSYPQQFVKEFTPTGSLVRQLTVPPPLGSSGDTARDLVADPSGNVYVYNGTFTPSLATYNPNSNQWTQQNYSGWGTVNNVSYGGLGLFQNYVFASDMTVAGDPAGASNGIVRFNVANGTATRFAQGIDFIDVNVGLDGKVYALTSTATLYTYDPNSMALLGKVVLPAGHDYRGVAVNASGDIFTANWDNSVSHFTPSGTLLANINLTGPADGSWFGNPMDIKVAADGTLAVGTRSGHVVQMTSAFANVSYFGTWTGSVQYPCFVNFATVPPPPTQPSITVADVSTLEGNSGTVPLTFTLTLSAASSTPVTVSYATAAGTATAGTDYNSISGSVTFAPGQTSIPITVPIVGDTLNEADETFYLNLSNPVGATLARSQAVGTIQNDDPVPSLTIGDVSANEGNSGLTPFTFTASLSAASGQTVQVFYATANGTAKMGTDYNYASGWLTFAPGQTTQTVTVNVIGNTYLEPNKTFYLNLSSPSNVTLARSQATGTILNDDTVPGLSVGDVSVTEGNAGIATATFTVTLTASVSQTVTVNYATANGTATTAGGDYQAASGTLTFAPGQTSQTVSILVNGDTLNEANETFYLNLSNPVGATLARGSATGTILNDDPVPSLSVNDVSVLEGNSGTTGAVFTISLSAPSGQTVMVNYATANGTATASSDYTSTSGTLTFAPGQTSQQVYVWVNGDTTPESNETFTFNLSSPLNATIARTQGTGTILNDDTALSVSNVSLNEGNSGTTAFTFTVSLSNAVNQTVAVNYATADGSATAASGDYQSVSGQLAFSPGQTSQTVTVLVNGDTLNEANETFFLNLSNPINATISKSQGTGTILNEDPVSSVTIGDISANEGNSGTTPFTFTLTLSAPSGQWTYVSYATANGTGIAGTDYNATSGQVAFAPGQTTQTVTVNVLANTINQANRTFLLNLSSPINLTIARSQATATILDDDPVSIYQFSQSNAAIVDDMAGQGLFTQISSGNFGLSIRKFTGYLPQGHSL